MHGLACLPPWTWRSWGPTPGLQSLPCVPCLMKRTSPQQARHAPVRHALLSVQALRLLRHRRRLIVHGACTPCIEQQAQRMHTSARSSAPPGCGLQGGDINLPGSWPCDTSAIERLFDVPRHACAGMWLFAAIAACCGMLCCSHPCSSSARARCCRPCWHAAAWAAAAWRARGCSPRRPGSLGGCGSWSPAGARACRGRSAGTPAVPTQRGVSADWCPLIHHHDGRAAQQTHGIQVVARRVAP